MTATRPFIAISSPKLNQAEIDAVNVVLQSGMLAQGPTVRAFEEAFAGYIGTSDAVACSSGTTALQLALLAHGVGPGDEVITTPFTFIATANAIRYVGARPVFADIDPETLNLDPASVEAKITPKTKAIILVHLYGNPCDMLAFEAIRERHGLALIEDACQAHGATYDGRRVGSFGTGCFSFYPTKNMTCGEGGMITTNDPDVAERASLLRAHGMKIRYLHEQLGFNFRMTDVHAAIGLAQLDRLEDLNAKRAANAAAYDAAFAGIDRPRLLAGTTSAWHQYVLMVEPARRTAITRHLEERGIGVGIYYPIPVHRQPAYHDFGLTTQCPESDLASERVFAIPVHPHLEEADRAYIIDEVCHALATIR